MTARIKITAIMLALLLLCAVPVSCAERGKTSRSVAVLESLADGRFYIKAARLPSNRDYIDEYDWFELAADKVKVEIHGFNDEPEHEVVWQLYDQKDGWIIYPSREAYIADDNYSGILPTKIWENTGTFRLADSGEGATIPYDDEVYSFETYEGTGIVRIDDGEQEEFDLSLTFWYAENGRLFALSENNMGAWLFIESFSDTLPDGFAFRVPKDYTPLT